MTARSLRTGSRQKAYSDSPSGSLVVWSSLRRYRRSEATVRTPQMAAVKSDDFVRAQRRLAGLQLAVPTISRRRVYFCRAAVPVPAPANSSAC
jgi:hypothetical protein